MTQAALERYDENALLEVEIEAKRFELQQRKAGVYAKSSLVPKDYQGNVGNVLIAENMARRMGADLLMVMQNLYVVQGRPGWSAQFLIGTFNSNGRFSAIKYRFKGDEHTDDWSCQAFCTEISTGDEISGTWVSWLMAKSEGWTTKAGSKWKTMPEQMFRYRAATFLIRATAPEIGLGLLTKEELDDMQPETSGDLKEMKRVGLGGMKERMKLVNSEPSAEQVPVGDVVDGDVIVDDPIVSEPLVEESEAEPEADVVEEVDVAIAADADPVETSRPEPQPMTAEEEAELKLFDLRKTATEIFRDLQKTDQQAYLAANKWLGTKSITQLEEPKLIEFLKKFAA
jgi:hypothetical protein